MDGQLITSPLLTSTCTDIIETQVSSKEVYETTNNKCESVVTSRTAHYGSYIGNDAGYHEYSLDVIETSPLSCCLAAEDYPENINACILDTVYTKEYTFDQDSQTCSLVDYV